MTLKTLQKSFSVAFYYHKFFKLCEIHKLVTIIVLCLLKLKTFMEDKLSSANQKQLVLENERETLKGKKIIISIPSSLKQTRGSKLEWLTGEIRNDRRKLWIVAQ